MKRIYVYIAMLLGLSLTSCNKWLDINTDPTSPSESQMTPAILMPGAEMNLASSYGDYLRITGGYYVQYYAHQFGTSNYIDYSQFQQSATRSSSTYTQLTARAIKNLTTARDLALASGDNASALAATVYRAFAYQVLVDCYGEIPYTEALDPSNTAPKFDGGDVIYAGILAELDEAIAAVGSNTAAPVCTNFLMPGSTAGDWIKFANALKLRIMMRQSGVVNNQDAVRKLIEADDALPTEDIAFQNCWKDETGQMSPFYAEEVSTKFGSNQQNVVANLAIFGTMWNDDYQDPRYEKCFLKNTSG
ncbi:MAG: SusD/RagB family nutrient-binding outer membrane lipoprotein, partial [Bacteroidaceae bacterium]|nr:SusD/RagB family nutrient-binding outer membrane lipoprotein [Bacteroidaceae bacterium]